MLKKIKSGGQGSVYKIKYKNTFYALKIKKILENEIKKILSDNKTKEIRRILDIVFELSFYSNISVNNLVKNNDDKYNLFMLLYPEKSSKKIIKISI